MMNLLYKKILVPHAGTPAGDKALEHAIHIAKSSSAQIILLHVIEELPHVPVFLLHASQASKVKKEVAQITKEMKSVMEKSMEKRKEMCKKHKIESNVKVTTGLPAEEILKVVKTQKIDLIVMAKRRKLKGIKKLLTLGSVSRKVIENTTCPSLLIDIEKR
jgi:nucleotide-binding universal stress UspA family protein